MSFLGGLKDFFLPSESVSAKRRLDVFGTESKAVAGTVIVGSAAALIAAPLAIAAGGGGRAVLASAGRGLAATSPSTRVALALAGPATVVAVTREPKKATRAVGGYVNFESNLADVITDPSVQGFKDLVLENPIISGGAAAAGIAALGIGLGGAASIANTLAIKKNTRSVNDALDAVLPSTSAGLLPQNSDRALTPALPAEEPLTPQTQVMGRQVTGTTRKRRVSKMRAERPLRVYNRVNILNQQIDK